MAKQKEENAHHSDPLNKAPNIVIFKANAAMNELTTCTAEGFIANKKASRFPIFGRKFRYGNQDE